MHFLHIVAVEAKDADEAIARAEKAIEPYGEGDVWDWYEVGGRWGDFFGEGQITLRYVDDPEKYLETLEDVREKRNIRAREAAKDLRASEDLKKISEGVANLSDMVRLGPLEMSLWEFIRVFSPRYCCSSMFFDAVTAIPSDPSDALTRVSLTTGDDQWLVAVDLHN